MQAQVIAAYGRHLRVRESSGVEHEARPFGRRLDIVCGDWVRCERDAAHGEVHAVQVLPRHTALHRSSARGDSEAVVANVTLMAVVVAPRPLPDLFVVDRYLCAASSGGIAALLVLNKLDLDGAAALRESLLPYEQAGYPVLAVAARERCNVDALATALQGQTGVLLGQSGVGKSSLVARLAPQAADIQTGELVRGEEGRHTTTSSRLYDLAGGGHLIDSPGVRDFAPAIQSLEPGSLGFVEVDRLSTGCRFADCRHMAEPGCAVREAAGTAALDARRYESYRRMRRLFDDLTEAQGPARRPGTRRGPPR
ncbi:MAG: ribosome small subunit-dependent GTPase A [Steroidobacteraceae bacterium]|nr:ribosome small subunit-dependent GTPase A [Steroidobacteraceae bacterium]